MKLTKIRNKVNGVRIRGSNLKVLLEMTFSELHSHCLDTLSITNHRDTNAIINQTYRFVLNILA